MPTEEPLVCFATMVRDDALFLRLWIAHYERLVPRDHLVILIDGLDQPVPDFADGCQVIRMPRPAVGKDWGVQRWVMLSDLNTLLLNRFEIVVLNDVDEILVVDPDRGVSLMDAIARAKDVGVLSPFAVELVHRTDICPEPIDFSRPIIGQRPHVRLNASYNKPCITTVPVRWSLGAHYSDFPTLNLDPDIYLFHLRYFDLETLKARQGRRFAFTRSATDAGVEGVSGNGWNKSSKDVEDFLLSLQEKGEPQDSDFGFDWQRKRMTSDWARDEEAGIWRHAKFANRRTYKVPERFHNLF
jgi:hypothetical protein